LIIKSGIIESATKSLEQHRKGAEGQAPNKKIIRVSPPHTSKRRRERDKLV
jgi:hypothetical protein